MLGMGHRHEMDKFPFLRNSPKEAAKGKKEVNEQVTISIFSPHLSIWASVSPLQVVVLASKL